MPRYYKRCAGARTYRDYSSKIVEQAILEVQRRILSYGQASSKYKIPKSTLLNKNKNGHPKSPGGQLIFTKEEELVQLIQVCGNFGQPLTKIDIRMLARNLLNETNRKVDKFKNILPDESWIERFLKRHKNKIKIRTAQNIKKSRAEITTKQMESYFENLKESLHGIPPENIINYDETNLCDDPGKIQAIFKRGIKYPELVRNFSKSATSIMFAGTAAGKMLLPYVVYKAEKLWSSWCEGGPTYTHYNRTSSGWFDAVTFCDWFKKVVVPLCRRLTGPKVLIRDNLSSHFNQEILKICQEMDIRFVLLPASSTHLSQPLNVVYFAPMKRKWRKILSDFKVENPFLHSLPKELFPGLLKKLMDEINLNSTANMKTGFEKCGIVPLNLKFWTEFPVPRMKRQKM